MHSLRSRVRGWSKQKVRAKVFQIIYFCIDYGNQILYSPIFDIIYHLRLDASENILWYTHIRLYFSLFIEKWNDVNLYYKYIKSFIEIIPLPEYFETIFQFKFKLFFNNWLFLSFLALLSKNKKFQSF